MPPVAERTARVAAVAAMTIGVVVLVGWATDLTVLTKLAGGDRPGTTVTTAVMVVVAGAGVVLRGISRWAASVLAAATAVVGILVVGEWTVGIDLGVHREAGVADEGRIPFARPSPSTAVTLAAFGLAALWLPYRGRWPRVGAGLAMGVFLASVLSIELGYVFEVPELIGVGHGVPIPSALALCLLAVALLAHSADRAPISWIGETGVARRIGRTLVPIAFLTPVVVGIAARLGQQAWGYSTDFRLVLFATSMAVVLTALTIAVGVAMVRAELALREAEERQRTDLQLAGMVQQRLLPSQPPTLPGYRLASTFIPAGAVGGDFYDWWLDDRRLLLVVADVMGKGAGAAIVGAGIRSSVTKELSLAEPGVAIARAAAELTVDLVRTGRFVTCFAATLEAESGRLDWVDAGHGLAMVRRADGSVQWLRSENLPLGIDDDAGWTQRSTVLEPGDALVAASDGLLDEIGTSADLAAVVAASTTSSADAFVDVLAHGLREPDDDVTLLVLRREESA